MRRLFPGVLGTLLVFLAGCGTDYVTAVDGMAEVRPSVLDFGRVALGSTAVKELEVLNRGRAPLQLRQFTIDGLGDDMEIVNRGKDVLRSGESTTLAVRYAPRAEAVLQRVLNLEVDDSHRPQVAVPVTGVGVQPRVTVEPVALDFGRIELNETEVRTFNLTNEFDIPVDVTLGRRGDEQYTFAPDGVVTVPPGKATEVTVTFVPTRVGTAVGEVAVLPCPTCVEQKVALTGAGIDRALVVVPDVIDFGFVAVDRTAFREFSVTNAGSKVLEVSGMQLVGGEASPFEVVPATATLAEGEQVTVRMSFRPSFMGLVTDTLVITSSSKRAPQTNVAVRGTGGGPEIKCTPPNLDFGKQPLGSRPHLYVTCSNIGVDPAAPPLQITGAFPADGGSQLFGTDWDPNAPGTRTTVPANGQPIQIPIWYEPNAQSMTQVDEGVIVITSNDGAQPEVRVPVKGSAKDAPPCAGLEVNPTVLDFGTLDERRGAVLSFTIRNNGDEACIMRDLDIAAGSDPVFFTRRVDSFVVQPHGWFGWMVEFNPARANAGLGDWIGEVELYAVNAGNQRYAIPLTARSGNGCLAPEPRFLDFGADPSGCGTRDGSVTFTNVCNHPIDVTGIEIGEGSADNEFQVMAAPGVPLNLPAGGNFKVDVEWLTATRGINTAPLFVTESDRNGPVMVPLIGELVADGRVTDRFVQHEKGKTDVLVVVDNSATMREEQARIAGSIGTLIDRAQAAGVDYHIAVTTTGIDPPTDPSLPACPGGANGAEAGRFFPVDASRPRVVTPATPNGKQVLADNTQVGLCQQVEQGMEAMRLALTAPLVNNENRGFLRTEANLAVIFISEDDDHSGYAVNDYITFLDALKGRGGARANAIVDINNFCAQTSGIAQRYLDLVNATGGNASSICAADWNAAFGTFADQAFAERTAYGLSQIPDANGIEVFVNGTAAAAGSWSYDAGSNSVRFSTPPAPGSVITVTYTATCR